MNKGLVIVLGVLVTALVAAWSSAVVAQVYKVVDENGNVTYTDQPPADGSGAVVLPEISVVETEPEDDTAALDATADPTAPTAGGDEALVEEEQPKTPRELRRMFSDFRILSPAPEESLWGTENTVVVSWGASAPYEPGMSVSVYVDGQARDTDPNGNLSITLDRGEHQVYAVLRDADGRRIITTSTVTFYIHQASRNFNPG
ncbi:MAG: DUF4124 domain-containing protein [Xanthomonadales bacterium]|nr:DUF4124 domain-containing protein [Xanthomonadales bacterium]